MSETVARQRPSVDLDDFERRLGGPSQRHSHDDDPLAELARLVGEQHDPYGDVFAQEPIAAQHEFRPSFDPHARQEPAFGSERPRFSADFAAIEAGLRAAAPAPAQQQPYAAPDYGSHADPSVAQHQHYASDPQFDVAPDEAAWADPARAPVQRGSRRPVYAIAASVLVAVVGIGVAFAYKGTSSSPREIKTIMAAAGPTKVQPPADATADQADQDANALGAQQAPTKLVSREEQPVDLSQTVQDNAARDAASRGTDAASVPVPLSPEQAAGTASPDYSTMGGATPDTASRATASPSYGEQGFGVGMPAPKKVKVVSVRPDGTILPTDAASDTAEPASAPPSKSADRAGSIARTATPKTLGTKSTSRAAALTPPPADDGDDAPAPKPSKSAKKTKPVHVASAETEAPAATATATANGDADAMPAGNGTFAVQLAAPGSEAEAKSATTKLLKKYGSALSGRRLGFHRAESNGHTVFRVRVSSLSKDDATSLCSKLKSDGGTCFVAKN